MAKKRGLLRSTSLVSFNTFLSRVLGFVRTMIFAHFFGAHAGMDAFIIAFRIPNFSRRLFAEGAFSQAFVPVLSEYRQKKPHEEVKLFINHIAGTMSLFLFITTVVSILIAPLLITIFAPGFSHEGVRYIYATDMLRITAPYLLFICLAALGGSVLNAYDSFGVPAFTPTLLNIVLIGVTVFVAPYFNIPIYALAWGVLVAGVIQLVFQWPFLKKKDLFPIPIISFKDPGVRRVLKLMVPALFGVSVAQVSIMLDSIFASFLKVGSVSWLFYSDRITSFPLGVFGVAIATVILPRLSRHHAEKDFHSYSKTVDWALRSLLIIGIPATIGILVLSGPILSTLLEYGEFSRYDVLMTRRSLIAFAIGIQAFMMVKVLASGFYAKQNVKTPVKIAVIAIACNMVLNLILIFPLAHAGLALATSLASYVNAGLLLFVLLRKKIYKPASGWILFAIQLTLSNAVLAAFLWWGSGHLSAWFDHGWMWRGTHLAILAFFGFVIYLGMLFLSGIRVHHFKV